MNRRDLVQALTERLDSDRKTVEAHLNAFVETVTEAVAKGEAVAVSGFAKFARVDRAAGWDATRTGVSIASGSRKARSRRSRRSGRHADGMARQEGPGQEAVAKKAPAK